MRRCNNMEGTAILQQQGGEQVVNKSQELSDVHAGLTVVTRPPWQNEPFRERTLKIKFLKIQKQDKNKLKPWVPK